MVNTQLIHMYVPFEFCAWYEIVVNMWSGEGSLWNALNIDILPILTTLSLSVILLCVLVCTD